MGNNYTHDDFIEQSKERVAQWTNENTEIGSGELTAEDVYVVWSCKVLQNSKALLATNNPDGMYFETTMNGNNGEIYFDAYQKVENIKLDCSK